jgi:hypothetical protein
MRSGLALNHRVQTSANPLTNLLIGDNGTTYYLGKVVGGFNLRQEQDENFSKVSR